MKIVQKETSWVISRLQAHSGRHFVAVSIFEVGRGVSPGNRHREFQRSNDAPSAGFQLPVGRRRMAEALEIGSDFSSTAPPDCDLARERSFPGAHPDPSSAPQSRSILLALLWQVWIEGVCEPHPTVRALPLWRTCEEIEDCLADGRQARLGRRSADSFFSAPLP